MSAKACLRQLRVWGDNRPVNLSHRVALIVLGSLSCFALAQTSPTETDLCSLVAHPKQFHNKVVRVTARVESAVIGGNVVGERFL